MNKKIIILSMCIAILIMTIGYSIFLSNIKINGTANITSTWNILFTKIEQISKTSGVVEKTPPKATGTLATFNIGVNYPGDKIVYEITVTNEGSLNAVINNISGTDTGNNAIYYKIEGINKGDKLGHGESKTFTVEIGYNSEVTKNPEILTSELTIDITYVQDLGQEIIVEPTIITNKYGLVSNGLMSYYDVKNGGSNSDTWKDLGVLGIDGKVDGATLGDNYYSFDRSNDCILLDKMNYPNITLEIATSINNITPSIEHIFIGNFQVGGYGILIGNNKIEFALYNSEKKGYDYFYYNSDALLNTMYTISTSYNESNVILCVNGTCQTYEATGNLGYPSGNTVMAIGCNPEGNKKIAGYFNGNIYSARIYNRALTKEEILVNQAKDIEEFSIN